MSTQCACRPALAVLAALLASASQACRGVPCRPTPREDRLPGVMARVAGEHPVWLADGSDGAWPGPAVPVKTLWLLSREASGSLRVEGRRLDGHGVVGFRRREGGPSEPHLSIPDPWAASVLPGGAPSSVLDSYAFVPSYLVYPSPGCWELTASVGQRRRRIVLELAADGGQTARGERQHRAGAHRSGERSP